MSDTIDLQGFSLSPQQERIWLLLQDGDGCPFRTAGIILLEGPLDRPALTAALGAVSERHEILRTVYRCLPGMSLPLQVIDERGGPGRNEAMNRPAAPAADLLAEALREPFDLQSGPLFRSVLVRLALERHALVVSLPALSADAVSLGVLLRDLAAAYSEHVGGPPFAAEPLQYADLADWQRDLLETAGSEGKGEEWERLLRGAAHRLPAGKAREGFFDPRLEPLEPGMDAGTLGAAARALGVSPRVFLAACWQLFLSRLTGPGELVLGISYDGRRYDGLDTALGAFARYLPVRLPAARTFEDLVRGVDTTVAELHEEQELFSWKLAGDETGFFPFVFDFIQITPPVEVMDLRFRLEDLRAWTDRFHLGLHVVAAGSALRLDLCYDAGRLQRSDVFRWSVGFSALLRDVLADLRKPVGEVEVLGAAERHRVLIEHNDTAADLLSAICVHERFEAQAASAPAAVAAVFGDQSLTYSELDRQANQLARWLRALEVGPGVLVGICLERSLDMVVAVLGVLKAGGAYLPLDPSYPVGRLAFMLADADVAVVLTQQKLVGLLPGEGRRTLCLDAERVSPAAADDEPVVSGAVPDDLAYVIYTSGSTGQPKGVMISHRGLANYLAWSTEAYHVAEGKGAPVHSPFGFDLTVTSLLSPLMVGRAVFLLSEEKGVSALGDLLAEQGGFSLLKITPAHLEILGPLLSSADLADRARVIVVGGEALRAEALEVWRRQAPETRIVNEYGPTEAVVGCVIHEVPLDAPAWGSVAIGRPVPNARIYLLNDSLMPVPEGADGEIHIAGVALARGYLDRAEVTAERFLPDPFASEPGARMYRTGDLARWREDGQLEFLGRIDHQVKIRGFRIELGEIEAALDAYSGVQEAVVLAREDRPGERRLVAYVLPAGSTAPVADELREHLARSLPEHMIPAIFEPVAAWPLTPNGKIDRKALPSPREKQSRQGSAHVAPRNLAEEVLAAIWADVLGLERVSVTDNFFELGGDSILSISVLAKARERGFQLSPQDFFRVPTLAEMARELLGVGAEQIATLEPLQPFALLSAEDRERLPADLEDAYPLTRLQGGMLFHSEHSRGSAVYHDITSFHLQGPLDLRAMRAAVEQTVQRHPALRTSFRTSGFSEPLQLVHTSARPGFRVEDLRHLSPVEQEEELAAWREREKRQPFEWGTPPLVRFQIHVRGTDRFQFTLSYHHAIVDGWSVASMMTELLRHYVSLIKGDARRLPALPEIQFRDFVALERQAIESTEQREVWRRQLAGHTVLQLPRWQEPAPEALPIIRQYEVPLTADLSVALQKLAAAEGVPLKTVALAAHVKALGLASGQSDVLTGLVAHGRPEVEGAEHIVGLFLNTLPFRLELEVGSWRRLVRRTFEVERDLLPHRRYPLAEIQRQEGGRPLFETIFNFVHFHVYQGVSDLAEIRPLEGTFFEETNFTFSANFSGAGADLRLRLDYDASQLADEQIVAIGGYYAAVLTAMVDAPDAGQEDLAPLSATEMERLHGWSGTIGESPVRLLHEVVADQARRTPDIPAVRAAAGVLTYADLNRAANLLARRLLALGAGPDRIVGVLAERSPEAIVGLLGILKAGAAYLPLDPAYPQDRLDFMILDSGLEILLTQRHLAPQAPAGVARVLILDPSEWVGGEGGADDPRVSPPLEALAYVIYTSGSTGLPKGVGVPHRGLANLIEHQTRAFGLERDSRVLQFASPSFDAAISEIGTAFQAGATLCLPGSREEILPGPGLLRLLREEAVTHVTLPPSVLTALPDTELPDLRTLIVAGEACTPDVVSRWAPGRSLVNAYGPTENTVCATLGEVSGEAVRPPIGRPLTNVTVHLLDPYLLPVPPGAPGQLYLGGLSLARGYLHRPDLTASRFVPASGEGSGARFYATGDLARFRPDGQLEFLGRADQQVKIRGFRIEPGEIEAHLVRHPAFREAAVVARQDVPGEARLVAYLVPEPGVPAARVEEIRGFLRQRVPEYMVPASFVVLEALPRTPNGKLDRRALPAPDGLRANLRATFVAPRTEAERVLAGIWREVLRVEQVGLQDNLFDLGGHSLHLLQIQGKIRQELGIEVPILDLLTHTTIGELAGRLTGETRLEQIPEPATAPRSAERSAGVAIIAMTGRFPGAPDVDSLWRNLVDGKESITFFTPEELLAEGISTAALADPGYVRAKGVLEKVEDFDATFFGSTPREAELTDPQQRLFLECAWEALERAGYITDQEGARVGVFAGQSMNSYLFNLLSNPELVEAIGAFQTVTINDKDFLATRVSYKLGLEGPSLTVQTACSTSLVAVHLACQSLLNGECEIALAGGVSVRVPQRSGYLYRPGGVDSPDGHCRAFDAQAQGTVAGNGVGIVVLKRLEQALADGDPVLAVIKGSAINNDGSRKAGYTAPRVEGQARVIRAAHLAAGVEADTISYVEAHGTGTALGDPIEVAALTQAFRASTARRGFCSLGTVKSNIGHLDAAAGVAGLIKAVLALRNAAIPSSLHFESPNPQIDFASSPFFVNDRLREWPRGAAPRRAGVSSFGIGGTNVHLVLEEAPTRPLPELSRMPQVLVLSARTATALEEASERLARHLDQHSDLDLGDVAYTLQVGRRGFAHRRMVVCRDVADATAALASRDGERVFSAYEEPRERPVAFLFSGQGSQYAGMAAEVARVWPVFRETVDRCAEILFPALGFDLREILHPAEERREEARRRLDETSVTQPALFTVEYALARLWMSWGVRPQAMLGHSIGEYVAACLAGVMSLEEALALVAERGRLIQSLPGGAMLSVSLPVEEALALAGSLEVAATNAPDITVLSGRVEEIDALQATLAERGIQCRRLQTSHAFHSALMDPVLDAFRERVSRKRLHPPVLPFVSNLTGTWIEPSEAVDPDYWVRHLRATVRFAEGVETLLREPDRLLLEVGPGSTLATLVRRHPGRSTRQAAISSLPHPQESTPSDEFLLGAAGRVWLAGHPVTWEAVHAKGSRHRVPLPTYPFERQRFWVEARRQEIGAVVRRPSGGREPVDRWLYLPSWKRTELPPRPRAIATNGSGPLWLLLADEGVLGQRLASRLEREGRTVVSVRPGAKLAPAGENGYVIDPRSAVDYRELFERLRGQGHLEGIVHLWSAGGDATPFPQAQERGFFSLVHLARALSEGAGSPVRLFVVTSGTQDVTGDEELLPERAILMGPCRVIPQELPHVSCRLIDLVIPSTERGEEKLAEHLAAELLEGSAEPVVAWRGNARWIPVFEAAPDPGTEPELLLRPNGVYVILGGLGRIGLEVASYLARTAGARLVLTRRSSFPAREEWDRVLEMSTSGEIRQMVERLRAIENLGAEIRTACLDLADEGALRALFVETEARWGSIQGVIHAAGVVGEGGLQSIEEIGEREANVHFRAKVQGSLALAAALEGRDLDFCLLFSSLASLLGGLGFTAYAAANAFQDALARQQGRLHQALWRSIDWDAWDFSGAEGTAIRPADADEILRRIFALPQASQIVVSTTDLEDRRARWSRPAMATPPTVASTVAPAGLHPRPGLSVTYAAPRNELEERIATIWQHLLGIEEIGIYDNFFELGGHSLLATQLAARLREAFAKAVPLRLIFDAPTVAGLAKALGSLDQEARRTPPPITRLPRNGDIPLSFAQQRLWFLSGLEPDSSSYNLHAPVLLQGELDLVALRQSLNRIVQRHEILHTSFGMTAEGAVQRIEPSPGLSVPVIDLGELPAEMRITERNRLSARQARRVFDLSRAPLLRTSLVRLATDEHVLLLTIHHIVWDAWSFGIFIRELATLYDAYRQQLAADLRPLPIQFADYAVWQRSWLQGEVLEAELDYWRRRLQGAPPLLPLPLDRPRPPQQTFRGARLTVEIPADLTEGLRTLSRREDATLFMALLAGFQVLLRYHSRSDDIVIGTDSAGREQKEVEELIGFFVNQLVLRNDLAGDPTFTELLGRVRNTTLEAYEHQELPFDRLLAALNPERNPSYAPLFQVKLVLQNVPRSRMGLQGLAITLLGEVADTAQLDLILNLMEGPDGISGTFEYNTDLFNASTIERMSAQLLQVLRLAIEEPEIRLDDLNARLSASDLRSAQAASLAGLRRARRRELGTEA